MFRLRLQTTTMQLKKPAYRAWLLVLVLQPLRAQLPTDKVVQAANTFLASLNDDQRQKVMYTFDDEKQRARWSNFPTPVVPRGGINLKQMTEQQQAAAMDLLATVLSPMGMEKVNQIRLADNDYKINGAKNRPQGGGPRGRTRRSSARSERPAAAGRRQRRPCRRSDEPR